MIRSVLELFKWNFILQDETERILRVLKSILAEISEA